MRWTREGPPVEAKAKEPSELTSQVYLEHLLKVSASVCQDAGRAWTEIWNDLRRLSAAGQGAAEGFVPECGWPAFMEKVWLLKHYIDSIQRICNKQQ